MTDAKATDTKAADSKTKSLREYQGLFILDVHPTKDRPAEAIKWLQEAIGRQGGQVTHANEWGKRRLVYAIKKKRDGFYVHLDFKLDPAMLDALQGQCRLNEEVLRSVLLKKQKPSLRKVRSRRREGRPVPP